MKGTGSRSDFEPQLSLQEGAGPKGDAPNAEIIDERIQGDEALFWQFNNSYIFIQVRGGIVVIDQHAAHERIIFDTSRKQLESEIPVSQQILFPITLELSIAELDVFKTSKDLFRKLGFHLEPFGGTSILVRGYPQGLKNWDEGRLLREMFDDLLKDNAPGHSHAEKIIASFACRSAVKAGQRLSIDEMKMLADQLFAVENPYSCPHGRPTIYRIALEDIERWFSRR
jgi:DNA mismatch repair protein MutL